MFFEINSNVNDYFKSGKLAIMLDSIGSCPYQERIIRTNGYKSHHFLWVDEGEGVFKFGEETVTLKKGQGVYFKANLPHEYYPGKDDIFSSSWLTFYGMEGLFEHYGAGDWFCFDANDEFTQTARSLYFHCIGNSTVISRSTAIYSFVAEFLESHFAPTITLAEKVDQFLEVNFAKDLSLDEIAVAFSMNKYVLCKQYQKLTGNTVFEQLKHIRCAKAKQYLINTAYPAEIIGSMCGFKSPSYFGKVFRETTGMTPRYYRTLKKI